METAGYIFVVLGLLCFGVFLFRPLDNSGCLFGPFRGFVLLLVCCGMVFGEGLGPVLGLFTIAYLLSTLAVPFILFFEYLSIGIVIWFAGLTLTGLALVGWVAFEDESESGAYRDFVLWPASLLLVTVGLWLLS